MYKLIDTIITHFFQVLDPSLRGQEFPCFGVSLFFSEPQLPHLQQENNGSYFREVSWWERERLYHPKTQHMSGVK